MMYLRQVYKQVSLLRKPNATVISDLARSNLFRQREGKICNHSQAREIVTVTSAGKDAISANARVLETSVNHRKKKLESLSSKYFSLLLKLLRRNPIEDGAISSFSGQKSVPE